MDKKASESIDLTFSPDWARKLPEKWSVSGTVPRQDAALKRGRAKTPFRGGPENRFGSRAGKREHARKTFRPASTEGKNKNSAPAAALPEFTVSFIPERNGLKPLVKQLAGTRRAYSLFEIAATFLSKPEFYAAAIETSGRDGQPAQALYQCLACRALFMDKSAALAHGLNQHLNLFYDCEEKDCEPPQGNFLCVARCTLSGELLGPPNHHEFSEKLQELHRTRFAHMPLEQYRKQITNETDPAAIEQWKKAAARKTIYRTKLLKEPLVFERKALLDTHFAENYAPTLVRAGHKFIVPATTSQTMDDRAIRLLIQAAWQKETRFPINMASAILKRFRRLGLHIFKNAKITFVSAVKPHPIEPGQTTDAIRGILEWILNNAGKTRQDLVAALVPGTPPESTAITGIIDPLVWLIDRGHVIEFMNGALSLPNRAMPGKNPASSRPPPVPQGKPERESAAPRPAGHGKTDKQTARGTAGQQLSATGGQET
jgi:hypothetical protein